MHGNVEYDFGKTKWKVREIPIQVCHECKNGISLSEKLLSENFFLLGGLIFIVIALLTMAIGLWLLAPVLYFLYLFTVALYFTL